MGSRGRTGRAGPVGRCHRASGSLGRAAQCAGDDRARRRWRPRGRGPQAPPDRDDPLAPDASCCPSRAVRPGDGRSDRLRRRVGLGEVAAPSSDRRRRQTSGDCSAWRSRRHPAGAVAGYGIRKTAGGRARRQSWPGDAAGDRHRRRHRRVRFRGTPGPQRGRSHTSLRYRCGAHCRRAAVIVLGHRDHR